VLPPDRKEPRPEDDRQEALSARRQEAGSQGPPHESVCQSQAAGKGEAEHHQRRIFPHRLRSSTSGSLQGPPELRVRVVPGGFRLPEREEEGRIQVEDHVADRQIRSQYCPRSASGIIMLL